MNFIAKVTSSGPQKPLGDVLRVPLGIDVWEVKPDHLILRGTEAQLDRLSSMGYVVEQLEDVARHLSAFASAEAAEQYHSAASLEEELRQLADARPDIAELKEIGRSIEGRPILALRIGDRRGGVPKLLFMGCHHAREWIAVEVPFLLAKELIERADEAPIAGWLTSGEIWVAPMVNPDGHEHSRAQERLWRKNRRRNEDGSFGVDPNRNYGYMWGILDVPTSSHVPSDETYVGPRAFSEPETQAIRDLVGCERFAGVITYHSYSRRHRRGGRTRRQRYRDQPGDRSGHESALERPSFRKRQRQLYGHAYPEPGLLRKSRRATDSRSCQSQIYRGHDRQPEYDGVSAAGGRRESNATTQASAVAGATQVACRVPPLMMCNLTTRIPGTCALLVTTPYALSLAYATAVNGEPMQV